MAAATPIGLEPQFTLTRSVSNISSNATVLRLSNGAQLSLPERTVDRPVDITLQYFSQTAVGAQPVDESGNAIPPPLNPQLRLTRTAGSPFWYQVLPAGTHFHQAAEIALPIPPDLAVVDAVTGQTRAVTDGEKSSQLKVVFFDGMEWVIVGGRFLGPGSGPDPNQTYITANTNHLSTFALALDQTPAQFVGGPLISEVSLDNTTFTPNGDGINDATTIRFALAEPASVSVRVFDTAGEVVSTVITEIAFGAGAGSVQWDGSYQFASRKVPAGTYIIEIKALTATSSRQARETIMVGVMK